jgi:hypothetical protein
MVNESGHEKSHENFILILCKACCAALLARPPSFYFLDQLREFDEKCFKESKGD